MATLVRLPGGSNNKGNYNKNGNYYVRLWLPNVKKVKHISTGTRNKKEAEWWLRQVKKSEALVRLRLEDDLLSSVNKRLGREEDYSLRVMTSKFTRARGLRISKSTIDSYNLALGDLMGAFKPSTSIHELTPESHDVLIRYLKDRTYSVTTINIRLRSIRAFFNWLKKRRYVSNLPFDIRELKVEKRYKKFIKPEEMEAIYAHIENPVAVSAIRVYEHTGIRKSELTNSTLEGGGRFLRVIGKGNKERIVPLPPQVLEDYKLAHASGYSSDFFSRVFTKARKSAGIDDREKSLHALRHTFAYRALMDSEMNLIKVRDILGHTSVKVTEEYARVGMDYLKEVFKTDKYSYATC
jgi:integrase/recombinase XerD|tara:strand:- start:64 stop:1119 length:1056 start_codon:yes stop_codon:yes gene_type:complete